MRTMLDQVIEALGLTTDASLARMLELDRSTVGVWRRKGIPAARRLQLAQMLQDRKMPVPDGLLLSPRKAA